MSKYKIVYPYPRNTPKKLRARRFRTKKAAQKVVSRFNRESRRLGSRAKARFKKTLL